MWLKLDGLVGDLLDAGGGGPVCVAVDIGGWFGMLVAVYVWGWFGVDDGGGLWSGGFGRVDIMTRLDRFQDT